MSGLDEAVVKGAAALAAQDGEFRLVAAGWTGALGLVTDAAAWRIPVTGGVAEPAESVERADLVPGTDVVVITASAASWQDFLAVVPRPPYSDFFGAQRGGRMDVAPLIADAARHNAVRRFGWLLRTAAIGESTDWPAQPRAGHGQHDQAVGRYVHLDVAGESHRIYYEQAGRGIPLLCHHTAASDARQWRHLLEDSRVTDRFRVIAYDLPFHGKSLPTGDRWWESEYVLTRDTAMAIAVALSEVLDLDRPVFVGSSIGGMLALDLARYHPDRFRGVIALQGGLRSSGGLDDEGVARMRRFRVAERLADPALAAARMMGMMSPTAPEASRQETMLHYAQAAPGVYAGDLYFHSIDHDLRGEAGAIDTSRCAVHLLTGEFDHTMVPITERAAAEISGASYTVMAGLGHFPMSEDHAQLMRYLLPVLDSFVTA
ncbi:MAG TPA: alpha/beta hydrolase [Pseudonocardiaceae bacterium]